jgi:hypothetical protein
MTDDLIRRAEHADLAAIVQLRREWTQEEHGDIAAPDFDEHLAAWFARELSRRIMWLAEEGGRPVGMMNLCRVWPSGCPDAPDATAGAGR